MIFFFLASETRNNKQLDYSYNQWYYRMNILNIKKTYSIDKEKILYDCLYRKNIKINVFPIRPFNFNMINLFFLYNRQPDDTCFRAMVMTIQIKLEY